MKRGVFITLEGGEGAGKSTLAKKICEHLQSKNTNVVLTREPGGTLEAEAIRSLVVEGDKDRFDVVAEALLFNAARRHHLKHKIIPTLQNGSWVICDRFVDSTFVYQGYVQGADILMLEALHRDACFNIFPELTFLLDVPTDIGLYRAAKRQHNTNEARFEQKGYPFHEAVRTGFLALAKKYEQRYMVLDGSLAESEIFKLAVNRIEQILTSHEI